MSIEDKGRTIHCDGLACARTTPSLVALHPTAEQRRAIDNWVFACIDGVWRHYCPQCAVKFLYLLSSESNAAPSAGPAARKRSNE